MEPFYQIGEILIAGISLAVGCSSLLTFLYKGREKVNLVFAALCLSVVSFVLLPPIGWISGDNESYQTSIKIKRIFNLSFMAFFPWFIALYTGYKKTMIPYIVTSV